MMAINVPLNDLGLAATALGAVVVLVGIVWALAIHAIPRCLASRFRYQLWRTRDELFDALETGTLPASDSAANLLTAIEGAIEFSHDVRLSVWLFMPKPPKERLQADKVLREKYVSTLSPDQKELFEHLREQFRRAVFGHLMFGSPSGWALLVFGLSMGLVILGVQCGWRILTFPASKTAQQVYQEASNLIVSPNRFAKFSSGLGSDNQSAQIHFC